MIPDITKAVTLLQSGGLVAFPTETVYGLGADASNASAVRKIFQAKERPYDHPLIVHLARLEQVHEWAQTISPQALKLAERFWPGPLTLILKKQPHVLDTVTGNQETIGLRIPRHPVAHALLQAFGKGVAAPSANRFTHISPTTAAAVYEELGNKVDVILDGGACEVGLESTIVDMSREQPVILRPGMITAQAIADALHIPAILSEPGERTIRAPGMHHLHYAPTTKTVLMATQAILPFLAALTPDEFPIALLTYSDLSVPRSAAIHQVKMPSKAAAYAHDLYHTLRLLDNQRVKRIIIEAVPLEMEWGAVRDRLGKASR
ncbi:MAG: threonylcarbamoyl-AMP synthase [Gammaproteobacteria bacterium]|nr:MAG: threonylcarbamoyl-AMP synthase [Gammaproteobacteria bacterium]